MRSRASLIAAMLLRRGDVDAMLCGTVGTFDEHLGYRARDHRPARQACSRLATMNMLMLPEPADLHLRHVRQPQPIGSEEIAEMTLLAADEIRRFGLTPVVALLSHSSFGSSDDARGADHARGARDPGSSTTQSLVVEGEMRATPPCRRRCWTSAFPARACQADANLLIMPNVDAANISYNLLKVAAGNGITVGPILLGLAKPAHSWSPASPCAASST